MNPMSHHDEGRTAGEELQRSSIEATPRGPEEAITEISKRMQRLLDTIADDEDNDLMPTDDEVARRIAGVLEDIVVEYGGKAGGIVVTVEESRGRMAQIGANEGSYTYAVYANQKYIAQIIEEDGKMRVILDDASTPPHQRRDVRTWLGERIPSFQSEVVTEEPARIVEADGVAQKQARPERVAGDIQEAQQMIAAMKEEVPVSPEDTTAPSQSVVVEDARPETIFDGIIGWFKRK